MGSGQSSQKKRKNKFSITHINGKHHQVNFDDFQILRAIGKGSFGKVCIVQKKDTMKMYAMKYMNKTQCVEQDAFKNVLKEIEILSNLEHPFLVNLWFTFQDEEDMFMVVDLLLGGDLRYHLQSSYSHFTEDRVALYMCEIALALDYLRGKRILHRDIKPDNILLDDGGHLRACVHKEQLRQLLRSRPASLMVPTIKGHAHITDFNIATVVREGEVVASVSGTKPYMAPEVVLCALDHTDGYSFPADWWSLGVTAYEMLCRKRPYEIHSGTNAQEIQQMIHSTCLRFPRTVDKGIADLVQQMLCINPKDRMSSSEQMKQHPYLRSVDFEAVYNRQVAPSFVPNKNQLNCDPTFELEEMIIEAKPLHKKKKRLSKRNASRNRSSLSGEDAEAMQLCLDSIQDHFIIYDRERTLQKKQLEEKEKLWEEELKKVVS